MSTVREFLSILATVIGICLALSFAAIVVLAGVLLVLGLVAHL